jgi:hypothetical protein
LSQEITIAQGHILEIRDFFDGSLLFDYVTFI